MTDQQAQAEAQKIVQEFQVIELSPEDDICVTFATQEIAVAKKCALIHVKGIIEETLLFGSKDRWERWKSILKAIEAL